ncbi:MAG: UTP--glucose-1-phosphate uridylyltransferase [Dehalococcoidia bacterium]
MAEVRKAVILAAGLGTRMLPATKAVPKELLPVADKPLLQYAVEEAVAAGVEHVIFVIAEGKEAIVEHFHHGGRVETWAAETGNESVRQAAAAPADLARFDYVIQDQPLGIAHAVGCAREFVENQPFALVFPDDIIFGPTPCLSQLVAVYDHSGSVIAVHPVSPEEIDQYGIVGVAGDGNPARVTELVEKPPRDSAPSNLGIVGRYILGPTIFRFIDGLAAGARGELQITDALVRQVEAGEPVTAFRYRGDRYDTGRPVGYVTAGVAAGLRRQDLAEGLKTALTSLLGGGR